MQVHLAALWLEYAAAQRAGQDQLGGQVLDTWEEDLRETWRETSMADRQAVLAMLREFSECARTPQEHDVASTALAFLAAR